MPTTNPTTDGTRLQELSERSTWEAMYRRAAGERFLPEPERRCSAYELDRIFRRHLPPGRGRRLLEMGCGGSKWLPYFALAYGFDVEGVDYAESGCMSARRQLERFGIPGVVTCADFRDLEPRFLGAFDVVTSWGVIEHFDPTREILERFAASARPGGLLVSYVPNFAGVMGSALKRLSRRLYDTHRIFDLEALVASHREARLEVTLATYVEFADFTVLPVGRLPSVLALALKNAFELGNRARLAVYRRTERRPQSPFWCGAMLVIARRPPERGNA